MLESQRGLGSTSLSFNAMLNLSKDVSKSKVVEVRGRPSYLVKVTEGGLPHLLRDRYVDNGFPQGRSEVTSLVIQLRFDCTPVLKREGLKEKRTSRGTARIKSSKGFLVVFRLEIHHL